jgi:hypothetical protein
VEKVTNVIQAVFARADSRVNSFAYFVKEIVATKELKTLAHRRTALAAIVKRVRENHQGREGYSLADLAFDTKAACAREGVIFDHDPGVWTYSRRFRALYGVRRQSEGRRSRAATAL